MVLKYKKDSVIGLKSNVIENWHLVKLRVNENNLNQYVSTTFVFCAHSKVFFFFLNNSGVQLKKNLQLILHSYSYLGVMERPFY